MKKAQHLIDPIAIDSFSNKCYESISNGIHLLRKRDQRHQARKLVFFHNQTYEKSVSDLVLSGN